MLTTRRGFGALAFGGLAASFALLQTKAAVAAAPPLATTFGGLKMGTCMYCYRDIARGEDSRAYTSAMLRQAAQSGAGLIEFNAVYMEPRSDLPPAGLPRIQDAIAPLRPGQTPARWTTMDRAELQRQREALRAWRLSTPSSYFDGIRREAEGLGLTPYSYVTTFLPDMTDAEIETQFKAAEALGCRIISTNQTKTEMAPRLVALCDRYKIDMGWHNHTQVMNPNEIASVQVFERLFALSPYMKANLDLGHFAAGNNDTLAFVKAHPTQITHFHMKDRKRAEGAGVPFGDGDAQLREVLLYSRDNRLNIGCIVEYEYPGTMSGLEETKRCINWMKNAVRA